VIVWRITRYASLKKEIEDARSIERLNFLAWIIKEDTKSGCDWVKQTNLKELREIWKQKREELERQK
jgi:hypothetical protein